MQNLDEEFIKSIKDIPLDVVIDFQVSTISTVIADKPVLISYSVIELFPSINWVPVKGTLASYSAKVYIDFEVSVRQKVKHAILKRVKE